MEVFTLALVSLTALLASLITILFLQRSKSSAQKQPPSPWKLPVIGHMHHLAGSPPHHALQKLSQKLGPLFYLQLGEIPTIVVSSPRLAMEILRTKDVTFASHAEFLAGKIMSYNFVDIVCAPYGEYWRQMRKICNLELLSAKRVRSFGWIRRNEGLNLITSIKELSADYKTINLTEKLGQYTSSTVLRAAIGEVSKDDRHSLLDLIKQAMAVTTTFEVSDMFPSLKLLHLLFSNRSKLMKIRGKLDSVLDRIIDQHIDRYGTTGDDDQDLVDVLLRVQESPDHQIPIAKNNIKAVLFDMFAGGIETSTTTVEWAMAELIQHPELMAKAQREIRDAFGQKEKIEETDIENLKYLKYVVKETLRLHAPGPLLVPRETREECEIDGYQIPAKTRVIINAWAIGRDPEYWEDPDSFRPDRFENCVKDFTGNDFEFIPFGSGRRICPGMSFGLANVYLPLALLLCHFNWELPDGLNPSELDMSETFGMSASRTHDLLLLAKLYDPSFKM